MFEAGGLTPLEGGWSGETFLAEIAGERSVVRLFSPARHAPGAAEVQAALLRLVRGLLPVPSVLEVRPASPETPDLPALLVTEFLPGVRGDVALQAALAAGDEAYVNAAGRAAGRVAARLAGMPQPTAGLFAGTHLQVEPFAADLPDWIAQHEPALRTRGWSDQLLLGLERIGDRAAEALDGVDRISLVHSDLNPKNLLLDAVTGEVTGVVDWEFAHAGHPYTDLGNLLRFDRADAWVDGVLAAWCEHHGDDPGQAVGLARSADLIALVDLSATGARTPVHERADVLLRAVAAAGDVHASA